MAGKKKANGEGSVYQRMDGRWAGAGYVLAADGARKRVAVYGDTRKEANDKLNRKLTDSNRGMVVAKDATITVGEYLITWLETVAKYRLRVTTYATYESLVRRYVMSR